MIQRVVQNCTQVACLKLGDFAWVDVEAILDKKSVWTLEKGGKLAHACAIAFEKQFVATLNGDVLAVFGKLVLICLRGVHLTEYVVGRHAYNLLVGNFAFVQNHLGDGLLFREDILHFHIGGGKKNWFHFAV